MSVLQAIQSLAVFLLHDICPQHFINYLVDSVIAAYIFKASLFSSLKLMPLYT